MLKELSIEESIFILERFKRNWLFIDLLGDRRSFFFFFASVVLLFIFMVLLLGIEIRTYGQGVLIGFPMVHTFLFIFLL